MSIEKLTEVEAYNVEHCSGAGGAKALRIIDAQASALAEARAECERLRGELEAERADCDEFGQYTRAQKLEEECKQLRVKLEDALNAWGQARLMNERDAAESRLAAANALLETAAEWMATTLDLEGRDLLRRIRAHLAGQEPVATRTESEQRVLDACADLNLLSVRSLAVTNEGVANLMRAEIARRRRR